ncbi:ATP-dependent endonuclease [Aliivibrio fischeri]|uniref:ATP-dependent nuclease n=1 Tax=Aliivibrio fischeri TaxID=668 RepID=UPI00080E1092|nr:AAA family ATPase [Aliivibrio fischeri]OCH57552.1 ATP-dependent endonuclease [Aliivibrio fischeri]
MSIKIESFTVKNYRSIGEKPITIELDDIVILVGGNNFGKSTILKAYHDAINSEKLKLEDFHNCNKDNIPVVEITYICSEEDAPSEYFRFDVEPLKDQEGEVQKQYRVHELYTWAKPDEAPQRVGKRKDTGKWASQEDQPRMPWSNSNAARCKKPKGHLVGTFSDPSQQSNSIKQIIVDVFLEERIKTYKPDGVEDFTSFETLVGSFKALKKQFSDNAKEDLVEIAKEISSYSSKIIPEHNLNISVNSSDDADLSSLKVFSDKDVSITFGREGSQFPLENHGSGARRTLLWSVLKKIADLGYEAVTTKKKFATIKGVNSHVLLLDEPELSLHPAASRTARDMLYGLAESNPNWQVMVTTHSPTFIDLTRNHTKIIRVEQLGGDIKASTIFRPEDVKFSENEVESLKLLNLLNPDVLEFFFGNKVLLIEGDTEFTAFGKVMSDAKSKGDNKYDDIFLLRCNGKPQIVMFMKILNHFNKDYMVLHDIDTKEIIKGVSRVVIDEVTEEKKRVTNDQITKNPAWTINENIFAEKSEFSRVYSSTIDFESAYFGERVSGRKPENAIEKLKEASIYETIENLLDAIIFNDDDKLPTTTVKANNIEEISDAFDTYAAMHPEVIPKL